MRQSLLQFFNKSELQNYVTSTHFEDKFMPYTTLPFLMHWSDHKKATEKLRFAVYHNERLNENYSKISDDLMALKHAPLWINLSGKVVQLSMYDVYHNLFITKNFSHDKKYGVSFIGPYGPFIEKKLFECLNFNTYKNFIYTFLIEGKLPQRTFRLQCEQQIILSHKSLKKDVFVSATIRSLSEDGMLVEVDPTSNMHGLKNSQNISFHISTSELNNTFNDAEKIITHNKFLYSKDPKSSFQINSDELVFRTSIGSKNELSHFIFARYDKAREDNLWPDLLKLASSAKDQVDETLDLIA